MNLNYKEIEQNIIEDISSKKSALSTLYQTVEEAEEYGYSITFGANSLEEGFKSAFNAGRKIGELEGEIDQLQTLLSFLYDKEHTKEG